MVFTPSICILPEVGTTNPNKHLIFTAGTTQTITGALTLTGTRDNEIVLESSSTPSIWSIDPQGTRTVRYVSVKDSTNINTADILAISSANLSGSLLTN